ncbi:hypothetical protein PoB_005114800 [Plakobranchus ocellatus]|uniref:Uncharacterized protein n=1 Tax=Plakobranchus ocellatus TaxID=259542 RepID=A0AAV4C0N9_9GAST|nr:hypothetical protein PoB_005114800 [Plakobranchus ocellatus]
MMLQEQFLRFRMTADSWQAATRWQKKETHVAFHPKHSRCKSAGVMWVGRDADDSDTDENHRAKREEKIPKLLPINEENSDEPMVDNDRCHRYCITPVTIVVNTIGLVVVATVNLAFPQQGDLRLSGPPSGQGAGGGARTRDRKVPADFRADSLATVPPTRIRKAANKLPIHYIPEALLKAQTSSKDVLDPQVGKIEMFRTLKYYSGLEGTDKLTRTWNAIMVNLECCGAQNYLDFHLGANWPPRNISGVRYRLLTPVTCFSPESSLGDADDDNEKQTEDGGCGGCGDDDLLNDDDKLYEVDTGVMMTMPTITTMKLTVM